MNYVSSSKRGFTLIELLVVIAIIAILAAILFPVFAQVREKARQSTCASNEKQLGVAIQAYVQDFDETLPPGNAPSPTGVGNVNWQYAIDPYIKGGFPASNTTLGTGTNALRLSVYHCPDWDITGNIANTAYSLATSTPTPSKSYVINANISSATIATFQVPNDPFNHSPYTLARIQAPAQLVLIAEGRGATVVTGGDDTATVAPETQFHDWGNYVEARARHSGGTNYLLTDGHVKWFRAPGNNRAADGTPVVSTTSVVHSQAQYPNAAAWFVEKP